MISKEEDIISYLINCPIEFTFYANINDSRENLYPYEENYWLDTNNRSRDMKTFKFITKEEIKCFVEDTNTIVLIENMNLRDDNEKSLTLFEIPDYHKLESNLYSLS